MPSKIEWTGASWNPVTGCSLASPGCTNCYAMRAAAGPRLRTLPRYAGTTEASKGGPVWTGKIGIAPDATWQIPLRRRIPTTYFVNSMGDLFHEGVPDAVIDRVFAIMALCPHHTFQILTKRAERMRAYMSALDLRRLAGIAMPLQGIAKCSMHWALPFPNVWLGVSAEDQRSADERIPALLDTPAAVRFVSCEPLLGEVDLTRIEIGACDAGPGMIHDSLRGVTTDPMHPQPIDDAPRLDWAIVGGESGPGARPCFVRNVEDIVRQCDRANVPVFVKQIGSRPVLNGCRLPLHDRKGGTMEEWPEHLRVREMPAQEANTP